MKNAKELLAAATANRGTHTKRGKWRKDQFAVGVETLERGKAIDKIMSQSVATLAVATKLAEALGDRAYVAHHLRVGITENDQQHIGSFLACPSRACAEARQALAAWDSLEAPLNVQRVKGEETP